MNSKTRLASQAVDATADGGQIIVHYRGFEATLSEVVIVNNMDDTGIIEGKDSAGRDIQIAVDSIDAVVWPLTKAAHSTAAMLK